MLGSGGRVTGRPSEEQEEGTLPGRPVHILPPGNSTQTQPSGGGVGGGVGVPGLV